MKRHLKAKSNLRVAFVTIPLALLFMMMPLMGSTLRIKHPNLTGTWRMNSGLSDDIRTKLENALVSDFLMSQRGFTNGDARAREREQVRRRMESLMEAKESLSIKQSDNEVTVTEGNLRDRKFYTDGRPYQREDRMGNRTTIKAQWHSDRLVVETRLTDGSKFTETYELTSDGRRLVVTTKSQDRQLKQALVIRRVYEAVPG